jgi:hypothetical protein
MNMANSKSLYCVDRTIEFPVKGGKQRVLRSAEPQEVPAAFVKEAMAKGLIRAAGSVAADSGDPEPAGGNGGEAGGGAGGAGGDE